MGFDLYGVKAKKENGEYFRNNVWWWRGLWTYVTEICKDVLTEKDITSGCYNDNHLIREGKANKMAALLEESIKDGRAKAFSNKVKAKAKAAKINNKGLTTADSNYDWATEYPFTISNVKEFAEFIKNSGGFRIC